MIDCNSFSAKASFACTDASLQDRRKHQQIALQTYLLHNGAVTPQPSDYGMYFQCKQIILVSSKPTPFLYFLPFIIAYITIEQKKCEYTKGAFLLYFSKKNAPYPHICETLFPSAQSILPYIRNRLQNKIRNPFHTKRIPFM